MLADPAVNRKYPSKLKSVRAKQFRSIGAYDLWLIDVNILQ
jgi:hypothetical protein